MSIITISVIILSNIVVIDNVIVVPVAERRIIIIIILTIIIMMRMVVLNIVVGAAPPAPHLINRRARPTKIDEIEIHHASDFVMTNCICLANNPATRVQHATHRGWT